MSASHDSIAIPAGSRELSTAEISDALDALRLPGSVLGVLTVGVLKNGLNVMAVSSPLQITSLGLLVITALLIDSLRGKS